MKNSMESRGDRAVSDLESLEDDRRCFGEFLRSSRMVVNKKPKTISDIAKELGKDAETVRGWEIGLTLPREPKEPKNNQQEETQQHKAEVAEFWHAIAQAYGVDVEALKEKWNISNNARLKEVDMKRKALPPAKKLTPDKRVDYFGSEKVPTHFSGGQKGP